MFTVEDRQDVIALAVAVWGAAPGADNLSDIAHHYLVGGNIYQLAENLVKTPTFVAQYPHFLTDMEFATQFIDTMVGAEIDANERLWAINNVMAQLNSGKSRAETIVDSLDMLRSVDQETNLAWASAARSFQNKMDVAFYHSVVQQLSDPVVANLQAVLAGVDSSQASVDNAKALIDSIANPSPVFTLKEVMTRHIVESVTVDIDPVITQEIYWGYNRDGGGVPVEELYFMLEGYQSYQLETYENFDFARLLEQIDNITQSGIMDELQGAGGGGQNDTVVTVDGDGTVTINQQSGSGEGDYTGNYQIIVNMDDANSTEGQIALTIEQFDFINGLLFDQNGDSRLFEVEVKTWPQVAIRVDGTPYLDGPWSEAAEGEILLDAEGNPILIDLKQYSSPEGEYLTFEPIILTPSLNNGGTMENGFTTHFDNVIVAGRLDLLHQAFIDAGTGYDILEVDAKGVFAQPLQLLNIEEVRVQNLPNIYTYGPDGDNIDPFVHARTLGDFSNLAAAMDGISQNSVLDLSRAWHIEKLVVTEGLYDGLADVAGYLATPGSLTLTGIRNGAKTVLDGGFTQTVFLNYSDMQGHGVDLVFNNLSMGDAQGEDASNAQLVVAHNSNTLNIESTGGNNYLYNADLGGRLNVMNITGDAHLYIERDLDPSFHDETPITIDASQNTGGVDLNLSGSQNVTFYGSQADDRFRVETDDMSQFIATNAGHRNDSSVTIYNIMGNNYLEVDAYTINVTLGDGHNNLEATGIVANIEAGHGNNHFELETISTHLHAGDGNNRIEIGVGSETARDTTNPRYSVDYLNTANIVLGHGNNRIDAHLGDERGHTFTLETGDGDNVVRVKTDVVDISTGAGNDYVAAVGREVSVSTGAGDDVVKVAGSGENYGFDDTVKMNIDMGAGSNSLHLGDNLEYRGSSGNSFPFESGSGTNQTLTAMPGSSISGENITLYVNTIADLRAAEISGVMAIVLDDNDGLQYSYEEGLAVLTITDQQAAQFAADGVDISVDGGIFHTSAHIRIIVTENLDVTTGAWAAWLQSLPVNIDLQFVINDGATLKITAQQLHTKVAEQGITIAEDNNTDQQSGKVHITQAGLDFDPFNSSDDVRSIIDGRPLAGGSLSWDTDLGFVQPGANTHDGIQRGEWGFNVLIDRVLNGYNRPADAPSYSRLVIDTDAQGGEIGPFSTIETFLRLVGESGLEFTPIKDGIDEWGRPIEGGTAIQLGVDNGVPTNDYMVDFSSVAGVVNIALAHFENAAAIYGNDNNARINVELGGNVGSAEAGLLSRGVATYVVTDIDVSMGAYDLMPEAQFWTSRVTEDLDVLGLQGNYGKGIIFGNTQHGVEFLMEVAYDKFTGYSVGTLNGIFSRPGADAVVNVVGLQSLPSGQVQKVAGIYLGNASAATINVDGGNTVIEALAGTDAAGSTDQLAAVAFNSAHNVSVTEVLPQLSVIDASGIEGNFDATVADIPASGLTFDAAQGATNLTLTGSVVVADGGEDNHYEPGMESVPLVAGFHTVLRAEESADFQLTILNAVDVSRATLVNVDNIVLGTLTSGGFVGDAELTLSMDQLTTIGVENITTVHPDVAGSVNIIGLGEDAFDVTAMSADISVGYIAVAGAEEVTLDAATDLSGVGELVVGAGTTLSLTAAQFQQLAGNGTISGAGTVHITGLTQADVDAGFDLSDIASDVDVVVTLAEDVVLAAGDDLGHASVVIPEGLMLSLATHAQAHGLDVSGAEGSILKLLFSALDSHVADFVDASDYDVDYLRFNEWLISGSDVNNVDALFQGLKQSVNKVIFSAYVELVDQTVYIDAGATVRSGLSFDRLESGLELENFTLNLLGGSGVMGDINLAIADDKEVALLQIYLKSITINSSGYAANVLTGNTANVIDGGITTGAGSNQLLNVTIEADQNLVITGGIDFESLTNDDATATLTVTGDANVTLGVLDTSDSDVDALEVVHNGSGLLTFGLNDFDDDLSVTGSGDVVINVAGTVDLTDATLDAEVQFNVAAGAELTVTADQVVAMGSAGLQGEGTVNIIGLADQAIDSTAMGEDLTINVTTAAGEHTLDENTDLSEVASFTIDDNSSVTMTAAQALQLDGATFAADDNSGLHITGVTQADLDADAGLGTLLISWSGVVTIGSVTLAEDVQLLGSELNAATLPVGFQLLGEDVRVDIDMDVATVGQNAEVGIRSDGVSSYVVVDTNADTGMYNVFVCNETLGLETLGLQENAGNTITFGGIKRGVNFLMEADGVANWDELEKELEETNVTSIGTLIANFYTPNNPSTVVDINNRGVMLGEASDGGVRTMTVDGVVINNTHDVTINVADGSVSIGNFAGSQAESLTITNPDGDVATWLATEGSLTSIDASGVVGTAVIGVGQFNGSHDPAAFGAVTMDLSGTTVTGVDAVALAGGSDLTINGDQAEALNAAMVAAGTGITLQIVDFDNLFDVTLLPAGLTLETVTTTASHVTLDASVNLTGADLIVPEGGSITMTAAQFNQLASVTVEGDADSHGKIYITDLTTASAADFDAGKIAAADAAVDVADVMGSITLADPADHPLVNLGLNSELGAFEVIMGDDQTFGIATFDQADGLKIGGGSNTTVVFGFDNPAGLFISLDASAYSIDTLRVLNTFVSGLNGEYLIENLDPATVLSIYYDPDEYQFVIPFERFVVIEAGEEMRPNVVNGIAFNDLDEQQAIETLNLTMQGYTSINGNLQLDTVNMSGLDNQVYLDVLNIFSLGGPNSITGKITATDISPIAIANDLLNINIVAESDFSAGVIEFNGVTGSVANLSVTGDAAVSIGGLVPLGDVDTINVSNSDGSLAITLTGDINDASNLNFTGEGITLTIAENQTVDLGSADLSGVVAVRLDSGAEVTMSTADIDAIGKENITYIGNPEGTLNIVGLDDQPWSMENLSDDIVLGTVTIADGDWTLHPDTNLTGATEVIIPAGSSLTMTAAQFMQLAGNGVVTGAGTLNITDLSNAEADINLSYVSANNGSITLAENVGDIINWGNIDGSNPMPEDVLILGIWDIDAEEYDPAVLNGFSLQLGEDEHVILVNYDQANGRDINGPDSAKVSLALTYNEDVFGTPTIEFQDGVDRLGIDASGYSGSFKLEVLNLLLQGQNVEQILAFLDSSIIVEIVEPRDMHGIPFYETKFTHRVVEVEAGATVGMNVDGQSLIFTDLTVDTIVRSLQLVLKGDSTVQGDVDFSMLPLDEKFEQLWFEKLTIVSQGEGTNSVGGLTAGVEGATDENNLLHVEITASADLEIGTIEFSSVESYSENATANLDVSTVAGVTVSIATLDSSDPHVDALIVNHSGDGTLAVSLDEADFGPDVATMSFVGENIVLNISGEVDLSSLDISGVSAIVLADDAELTLTADQLAALDINNISVPGVGNSAVLNILGFSEAHQPLVNNVNGLDIGEVTLAATAGSTFTFDDGNAFMPASILVPNGVTIELTADQYAGLGNATIAGLASTPSFNLNLREFANEHTGLDLSQIDTGNGWARLFLAEDVGEINYNNPEALIDYTLPSGVLIFGIWNLGDGNTTGGWDHETDLGAFELHLVDGDSVRLINLAQAEPRVIVGEAGATVALELTYADLNSGTIDLSTYQGNFDLQIIKELILGQFSMQQGNVEGILFDLSGDIAVIVVDLEELPGGALPGAEGYTRQFTVEPDISIEGGLIFADMTERRFLENLEITLQGNASIQNNVDISILAPIDLNPAVAQGYFNLLTINSENLSSDPSAQNHIGSITAGAGAAENNLLYLVINADSDLSIGAIELSYVEGTLGSSTTPAQISVNTDAGAVVSLGVIDAREDTHVSNVYLSHNGDGVLNVDEIDIDGSVVITGDGATVIDLIHDSNPLTVESIDASGASGPLTINDLSGVSEVDFSFTSGTGVNTLTFNADNHGGETLAAAAGDAGWHFDFSQAAEGSSFHLNGGTYTSGSLTIDLGVSENTTLYIGENVDFTALGADLDIIGYSASNPIVVKAGATLTLTPEQADGLHITGPGTVEVEGLTTATGPVDLSNIDVGTANIFLGADDVTVHADTNLGDFGFVLDAKGDTFGLGQTIRFSTVEQADGRRVDIDDPNSIGTDASNIVWLFTDALPDGMTGIDTSGYSGDVGRLWLFEQFVQNNPTVDFGELAIDTVRVDEPIFLPEGIFIPGLDDPLATEKTLEFVSFVGTSAQGPLNVVVSDTFDMTFVQMVTLDLGGSVNLGTVTVDNELSPNPVNPDTGLVINPAVIVFERLTINSKLAMQGTTQDAQGNWEGQDVNYPELVPENWVEPTSTNPLTVAFPVALNIVGDIMSGPGFELKEVVLDAVNASLETGVIYYDIEDETSGAVLTVNDDANTNHTVSVEAVDLTDVAGNDLTIDGDGDLTVVSDIVYDSADPGAQATLTINEDVSVVAKTMVMGSIVSLGVAQNSSGNVSITGGSPSLVGDDLEEISVSGSGTGHLHIGSIGVAATGWDGSYYGIAAPSLHTLDASGTDFEFGAIITDLSGSQFAFTSGEGLTYLGLGGDAALAAGGNWNLDLSEAAADSWLAIHSDASFDAGTLSIDLGDDASIGFFGPGVVDLTAVDLTIDGTGFRFHVEEGTTVLMTASQLVALEGSVGSFTGTGTINLIELNDAEFDLSVGGLLGADLAGWVRLENQEDRLAELRDAYNDAVAAQDAQAAKDAMLALMDAFGERLLALDPTELGLAGVTDVAGLQALLPAVHQYFAALTDTAFTLTNQVIDALMTEDLAYPLTMDDDTVLGAFTVQLDADVPEQIVLTTEEQADGRNIEIIDGAGNPATDGAGTRVILDGAVAAGQTVDVSGYSSLLEALEIRDQNDYTLTGLGDIDLVVASGAEVVEVINTPPVAARNLTVFNAGQDGSISFDQASGLETLNVMLDGAINSYGFVDGHVATPGMTNIAMLDSGSATEVNISTENADPTFSIDSLEIANTSVVNSLGALNTIGTILANGQKLSDLTLNAEEDLDVNEVVLKTPELDKVFLTVNSNEDGTVTLNKVRTDGSPLIEVVVTHNGDGELVGPGGSAFFQSDTVQTLTLDGDGNMTLGSGVLSQLALVAGDGEDNTKGVDEDDSSIALTSVDASDLSGDLYLNGIAIFEQDFSVLGGTGDTTVYVAAGVMDGETWTFDLANAASSEVRLAGGSTTDFDAGMLVVDADVLAIEDDVDFSPIGLDFNDDIVVHLLGDADLTITADQLMTAAADEVGLSIIGMSGVGESNTLTINDNASLRAFSQMDFSNLSDVEHLVFDVPFGPVPLNFSDVLDLSGATGLQTLTFNHALDLNESGSLTIDLPAGFQSITLESGLIGDVDASILFAGGSDVLTVNVNEDVDFAGTVSFASPDTFVINVAATKTVDLGTLDASNINSLETTGEGDVIIGNLLGSGEFSLTADIDTDVQNASGYDVDGATFTAVVGEDATLDLGQGRSTALNMTNGGVLAAVVDEDGVLNAHVAIAEAAVTLPDENDLAVEGALNGTAHVVGDEVRLDEATDLGSFIVSLADNEVTFTTTAQANGRTVVVDPAALSGEVVFDFTGGGLLDVSSYEAALALLSIVNNDFDGVLEGLSPDIDLRMVDGAVVALLNSAVDRYISIYAGDGGGSLDVSDAIIDDLYLTLEGGVDLAWLGSAETDINISSLGAANVIQDASYIGMADATVTLTDGTGDLRLGTSAADTAAQGRVAVSKSLNMTEGGVLAIDTDYAGELEAYVLMGEAEATLPIAHEARFEYLVERWTEAVAAGDEQAFKLIAAALFTEYGEAMLKQYVAVEFSIDANPDPFSFDVYRMEMDGDDVVFIVDEAGGPTSYDLTDVGDFIDRLWDDLGAANPLAVDRLVHFEIRGKKGPGDYDTGIQSIFDDTMKDVLVALVDGTVYIQTQEVLFDLLVQAVEDAFNGGNYDPAELGQAMYNLFVEEYTIASVNGGAPFNFGDVFFANLDAFGIFDSFDNQRQLVGAIEELLEEDGPLFDGDPEAPIPLAQLGIAEFISRINPGDVEADYVSGLTAIAQEIKDLGVLGQRTDLDSDTVLGDFTVELFENQGVGMSADQLLRYPGDANDNVLIYVDNFFDEASTGRTIIGAVNTTLFITDNSDRIFKAMDFSGLDGVENLVFEGEFAVGSIDEDTLDLDGANGLLTMRFDTGEDVDLGSTDLEVILPAGFESIHFDDYLVGNADSNILITGGSATLTVEYNAGANYLGTVAFSSPDLLEIVANNDVVSIGTLDANNIDTLVTNGDAGVVFGALLGTGSFTVIANADDGVVTYATEVIDASGYDVDGGTFTVGGTGGFALGSLVNRDLALNMLNGGTLALEPDYDGALAAGVLIGETAVTLPSNDDLGSLGQLSGVAFIFYDETLDPGDTRVVTLSEDTDLGSFAISINPEDDDHDVVLVTEAQADGRQIVVEGGAGDAYVTFAFDDATGPLSVDANFYSSGIDYLRVRSTNGQNLTVSNLLLDPEVILDNALGNKTLTFDGAAVPGGERTYQVQTTGPATPNLTDGQAEIIRLMADTANVGGATLGAVNGSNLSDLVVDGNNDLTISSLGHNAGEILDITNLADGNFTVSGDIVTVLPEVILNADEGDISIGGSITFDNVAPGEDAILTATSAATPAHNVTIKHLDFSAPSVVSVMINNFITYDAVEDTGILQITGGSPAANMEGVQTLTFNSDEGSGPVEAYTIFGGGPVLPGDAVESANLVIIFDLSLEMGVAGRLDNAKAAAIAAIEAIDLATGGETGVRLVTYNGATAVSNYAGGEWLDAATAIASIDALTAANLAGGASHKAAVLEAQNAFLNGQNANFYADGLNASFFLSSGNVSVSQEVLDGMPESDNWQQFLRDNAILSNAIGFGNDPFTAAQRLESIAYDGISDVDIPSLFAADDDLELVVQALAAGIIQPSPFVSSFDNAQQLELIDMTTYEGQIDFGILDMEQFTAADPVDYFGVGDDAVLWTWDTNSSSADIEMILTGLLLGDLNFKFVAASATATADITLSGLTFGGNTLTLDFSDTRAVLLDTLVAAVDASFGLSDLAARGAAIQALADEFGEELFDFFDDIGAVIGGVPVTFTDLADLLDQLLDDDGAAIPNLDSIVADLGGLIFGINSIAAAFRPELEGFFFNGDATITLDGSYIPGNLDIVVDIPRAGDQAVDLLEDAVWTTFAQQISDLAFADWDIDGDASAVINLIDLGNGYIGLPSNVGPAEFPDEPAPIVDVSWVYQQGDVFDLGTVPEYLAGWVRLEERDGVLDEQQLLADYADWLADLAAFDSLQDDDQLDLDTAIDGYDSAPYFEVDAQAEALELALFQLAHLVAVTGPVNGGTFSMVSPLTIRFEDVLVNEGDLDFVFNSAQELRDALASGFMPDGVTPFDFKERLADAGSKSKVLFIIDDPMNPGTPISVPLEDVFLFEPAEFTDPDPRLEMPELFPVVLNEDTDLGFFTLQLRDSVAGDDSLGEQVVMTHVDQASRVVEVITATGFAEDAGDPVNGAGTMVAWNFLAGDTVTLDLGQFYSISGSGYDTALDLLRIDGIHGATNNLKVVNFSEGPTVQLGHNAADQYLSSGTIIFERAALDGILPATMPALIDDRTYVVDNDTVNGGNVRVRDHQTISVTLQSGLIDGGAAFLQRFIGTRMTELTIQADDDFEIGSLLGISVTFRGQEDSTLNLLGDGDISIDGIAAWNSSTVVFPVPQDFDADFTINVDDGGDREIGVFQLGDNVGGGMETLSIQGDGALEIGALEGTLTDDFTIEVLDADVVVVDISGLNLAGNDLFIIGGSSASFGFAPGVSGLQVGGSTLDATGFAGELSVQLRNNDEALIKFGSGEQFYQLSLAPAETGDYTFEVQDSVVGNGNGDVTISNFLAAAGDTVLDFSTFGWDVNFADADGIGGSFNGLMSVGDDWTLVDDTTDDGLLVFTRDGSDIVITAATGSDFEGTITLVGVTNQLVDGNFAFA